MSIENFFHFMCFIYNLFTNMLISIAYLCIKLFYSFKFFPSNPKNCIDTNVRQFYTQFKVIVDKNAMNFSNYNSKNVDHIMIDHST